MIEDNEDADGDTSRPAERRLSYKFQRLRERIRAAIDAGELVGKLPGERSLARQFNVNAKTLSKALTDLAAEGVLQRSIGLGTFVRDGAESSVAGVPTVLLLANDGRGATLAAALAARGLDVTAHLPDTDLPPSVLAPFGLVLVASADVSDETIRDLLVRGKSVVTIDRVSTPYSTHAILPHLARSAADAALLLVEHGNARLCLVTDGNADSSLIRAVVDAVPQARVRPTDADSLAAATREGFDGVVCDAKLAVRVRQVLDDANIRVPQSFALIAFGRLSGSATCCGFYVTDDAVAAAVVDLVHAGLPHQPVSLWLAGENIYTGTSHFRPEAAA